MHRPAPDPLDLVAPEGGGAVAAAVDARAAAGEEDDDGGDQVADGRDEGGPGAGAPLGLDAEVVVVGGVVDGVHEGGEADKVGDHDEYRDEEGQGRDDGRHEAAHDARAQRHHKGQERHAARHRVQDHDLGQRVGRGRDRVADVQVAVGRAQHLGRVVAHGGLGARVGRVLVQDAVAKGAERDAGVVAAAAAAAAEAATRGSRVVRDLHDGQVVYHGRADAGDDQQDHGGKEQEAPDVVEETGLAHLGGCKCSHTRRVVGVSCWVGWL